MFVDPFQMRVVFMHTARHQQKGEIGLNKILQGAKQQTPELSDNSRRPRKKSKVDK